MSDADDDRRRGVELGDLSDDLESHDYPATTEELIESYGDRELDLPSGTETVRDSLEPVGEETYESAEEVREMLVTMVSSDAVGREGYSDRGAGVEGGEEGEETEQESL